MASKALLMLKMTSLSSSLDTVLQLELLCLDFILEPL
ncbi:hypothetical protein Tco_0325012, partial [Tanacetum coccineum]